MSARKAKSKFYTLVLGALGVVFGDIGTSPIYAFRETLQPHHLNAITPDAILGVISIICWTIAIIISIKYVSIIMCADNNGEGGTLTLLSLIHEITKNPKVVYFATILAMLGTSFFLGDCMLTPAISVLSAVEGLAVVNSGFEPLVLPITLVALSVIFLLQQYGSGVVGRLFGPIMFIWFLTLAVLGVSNIFNAPEILKAVNPSYAIALLTSDYHQGFSVLGSAFLAITGGEALYADMGHFGRGAIRFSWFSFVWPSLLLNYFGQGALILSHPEYSSNPFYLLAPPHLMLPLVLITAMATIIASQAVLTGAFSIFQQAVQLDFFPRIQIKHTSDREEGQIYLPFVNWMIFAGVVLLVFYFKTSSTLAGAYGISVAGTMFISTPLVAIVMFLKWKWPWYAVALIMGAFFIVDSIFMTANIIKIPDGGWISLVIASICFTCLSTWRKGRIIVNNELKKRSMDLDELIAMCDDAPRIRGTAVVLTGNSAIVPIALLHNLEHNRGLHERIIVITVVTEHVPTIDRKKRLELKVLPNGFYFLSIHCGYMQSPNIPRALAQCSELGLSLDLSEISFLLRRSTIIPTHMKTMAKWRKHLFAFMTRNAVNAAEFYHLPSSRVIELGVRTEI